MAIVPIGGIPLPIGPEFSTLGKDFQVGGVDPSLDGVGKAGAAAGGSGGGFGGMLEKAIGSVDQSQQDATKAASQVLTGGPTELASVVAKTQQAELTLQLATQVRNKVVEAYQEIMRMNV